MSKSNITKWYLGLTPRERQQFAVDVDASHRHLYEQVFKRVFRPSVKLMTRMAEHSPYSYRQILLHFYDGD